jgi:DNA polymerase III subunit alpha
VTNNYAPLHLHTHYSQMDGVATPEEYMERAVENGMTAAAMTDHGTLSGHRAWVRAAKAHGIKPILGLEAYYSSDRFDKRDKKERTEPLDRNYHHLIVLAKNDVGLENLNRMNEIAWNEGYYSKPRIDFELLDKYGEGLIISTACMGSFLNQAIENDDYAAAKAHLKQFGDRFGDDFYVEVMPHNIEGMNKALIELANAGGHKIIVTPDCHHATVDQKVIQEIMLINNTHAKFEKDVSYDKSRKIDDPMDRLDYLYGHDRMMSFNKFDIHLLSYEEMRYAMQVNMYGDLGQNLDYPLDESMFTNTLEVADKVEEYTIRRNLNLLPVEHKDPDAQLRRICEKALKEKGLDNDPESVARMNEELDIIKLKKFASYFLVVMNLISYARRNDIMVGPGRGSSAGSFVCFLTDITQINPLPHGLLFFRFIDIDRDDWPDIDTDIQDTRREEIKQYLEDQYKHVASIATFLTFKDKGVVRDVARCFNVPLADVNRALKTVDTWEEYIFSKNTEWFRDKYPEVEQYGGQLRGRIRGTGVHAAGIVTSKMPVSKVAPMETRSVTGQDGRIPVVAVDMEEAADIGLIKIDALGLKTLTVISDTLDIIKDRTGKRPDLLTIDMEDRKIYEMLSDGHTKGVFQCEAAPYTNLLVKMGVGRFDELVASNALVRPGAMNTIGKEYIARKHGKQMVTYPHPIMQEFTSDTYGTILYQEQVMLACTKLGGMSMGEANKVRKIIGKKKDASEFDQFKELFIRNASGPLGSGAAEKMWHDFEAHAGYSFNKSHAVAYSTLSYWTAWLKVYYPLEFMFALLNNEKDSDARTEYLIEAKRMGIPMRLPHINDSAIDFKIEGKGIRFGLASIKYISHTIAERYIAARPFKSFEEVKEFTFTKGNGVNSRALESMRAVGALTFPDNPRNDDEVRGNMYEYLKLPEFNIQVPQHYHAYISDMDDFDEKGAFILMGLVRAIKRGKGWSRVDILDSTGSIGVFDDEETKVEAGRTYIFLVGSNRIVEAVPIDELQSSKSPLIRFLNYKTLPYGQDEYFVLSFKSRITKAGKRMASLVVADSGRDLLSMVVFPTTFAMAYTRIDEGNAYKINYSLSKEDDLIFQEIVA